jgi:multidrug efflux system outer membrane protein
MEPRYRAPALPVPTQWPIPPSTAGDEPAVSTASGGPATSPASDVGWRDFFVDTRLQQLIALALANNRDLRVAVLNLQQARGQYHVQRAAEFPTVDLTGEYSKEKVPAAATGLGFPITSAYYSAGAGISSYELDLFGRVRSLSHAALEQYFEQEEARRSTQLSLIAEVADAYLTLAGDRELLDLAQQTLQSQQKSFDLAQRQHDAGSTSGLDVAQAQTSVETARADAARYEGSVAQDINALQLLVGTQIDPATLPQGFDVQTIGLDPLPAGLPSTVLLRRPDVLEAEHALRSANANIGAARAAFFPTISLTGTIGSASPQLSGLFSSGTQQWTFAPQITWPIFEGGALLGRLAVAHSNRDIAVAQYEKAIQTGFREVADALVLTTALQRQRQAQEALVGATGRAYELSEQRYRAGSSNYLNVLDSQRSNYSAQQNLISTRLSEQSNRVTLYKVLGGGWLERSP